MTPLRSSGLQLDVLKLYRELLRSARKKDPENKTNMTRFGEFTFLLS
jgi:Complex 1 protein (LYR family)